MSHEEKELQKDHHKSKTNPTTHLHVLHDEWVRLASVVVQLPEGILQHLLEVRHGVDLMTAQESRVTAEDLVGAEVGVPVPTVIKQISKSDSITGIVSSSKTCRQVLTRREGSLG